MVSNIWRLQQKLKKVVVLQVHQSLRARLLLLLFLVVLPPSGLLVFTTVNDLNKAKAEVAKDALQFAYQIARQPNEIIPDPRYFLENLSKDPVVLETDRPDNCNRLLAGLLKVHPYFVGITVARPNGDLLCSGLPMDKSINVSDRSYFRRALETREFAIGDYQIGRRSKKAIVAFASPVFDTQGRTEAVVYLTLDLSWLNEVVAKTKLPADSMATVLDAQGTVLAGYGGAETLIGRSIPELQAYKSFSNRRAEGTAEWVGLDHVVRINAYVPLYTSSAASIYVRVGIPKYMAYSKVRDEIIRTSLLLALIGLTVLAVAWYGSSWLILRRINALSNAATRMGQGDLGVRTGLPHSGEEIGQLARSFDEMAEGLQRSRHAVRALTAANRTLVRAQDEDSLLHEMCKAIVEVGGYRMAWVGITNGNKDKSIRPVAHWGIEEGFLDTIKLYRGGTEPGGGPAVTAIRTGVPCVVRSIQTDPRFEPWRKEALTREYASAVAFPLRIKGEIVGVLSIYAAERDAFGTKEIELLGEMVDDLTLGLATLRLRNQHEQAREELARTNRRLQLLSRRLLTVQESERRHLARELHDEIGQALTAVSIGLQAKIRDERRKPSAKMNDCLRIVDQTMQKVRSLSLNLRPPQLDDLGLAAAMEWLVGSQAAMGGPKYSTKIGSVDPSLNHETKVACFRVCQEALTNAARHAKASEVRIELTQQNGSLYLTVKDDGQGFDVRNARKQASEGGSIGLVGMEERVALVSGELKVSSVRGKGTEIHAIFPLATTVTRRAREKERQS